MKARIIETKPILFPIDVNGKRYYSAFSMAVISEIAEKRKEGVMEYVSRIEEFKVAAEIVAMVVNNAIRISNIENGTDEKFITAEYINLISDYTTYAEYLKQLLPMIQHAFPAVDIKGTEATGEDEDIDDSDVPVVEQKN